MNIRTVIFIICLVLSIDYAVNNQSWIAFSACMGWLAATVESM